MVHRAVVRIALVATLSACRRAPPEPSIASRSARGAADDPASSYRPALDESGRRIFAALVADGGVGAAVEQVARIEVPAVPARIDIVAARVGGSWTVAAVERDRVTLGLAGAERILTLLNESHRPPAAVDLARIVGALHFYPWPTFDGATWSRTGEQVNGRGGSHVPQFVQRSGGTGRALLFEFWIPDGNAGAGPHMANIRVTDSGLLIDEAPRPDRR